jgi:hypothetical protein
MLLLGCSADCIWVGEGHAFIDTNENGYWNSGEPPLEGVQFHVVDVRNGHLRTESGLPTSDIYGRADISTFLAGCPRVELEVYAVPPAGYRLTSKERVPVHARFGGIELVRFGFVAVES